MGKMLKVCNIYCAKSTAFQWHQHKEKKKKVPVFTGWETMVSLPLVLHLLQTRDLLNYSIILRYTYRSVS